MPTEQTLQVILPAQEAAGIRALAGQHGVSVSAYIRNLVLARSVPLVAAWWVPHFEADTPEVNRRKMRNQGRSVSSSRPPELFLERSEEGPEGSAEYNVFEPDGRPLTSETLRARYDFVYGHFETGRLVLAGSPTLWRVVRSLANVRAKDQLRWLLVADRSAA